MCAVDMAVTIALEYMNTLRAEIESRNKAVLMLASGKLAFFVSLVTAIAAVTTTSGIEVSVIIIFSPLMLLLFDVMIHEQIHGIFLIGSYIHTEIEQKVLAKHLDGQPDKRLVLWQTYQSVFRDARGSDDEEAKRDDKPWTVSLLRGRLHGEMAHVYVTWMLAAMSVLVSTFSMPWIVVVLHFVVVVVVCRLSVKSSRHAFQTSMKNAELLKSFHTSSAVEDLNHE